MNASDRSAYASSWYTETKVGASPRTALGFDLDVDVCVVGGGLAGLTAAREIARRGWSVALLEARRIAWNASGRNCGFVLPGFAETMDNVVKRVGLAHAKTLWSLSEAGVEYVRNTIRDSGMPGTVPVDGWLKVSKVDDAEEDLATVQLLGQEFGADIEGWPVDRVRDVLKTDHYFHAIHVPRAFHIHPLNYALGLAAAAETAGVRIFEDTPVQSIDPMGVRKRIVTPSGRVRAAHVVLAGNVHLGSLVPRLAGTLLPIWTYVATTKPFGSRLERAMTYRGAVSDTDFADNHYRIVDGDRLLWSGGMTTWEADPKRFAKQLCADMQELYPQLGGVEIDHIWSGVLGTPLHRMPQIGEFSPGMWIASGFAGHGFNTTAMAGTIIADSIVEGGDSWRLFAPFEFVWAGGGIGRVAAQIYYKWYRRNERNKAKLARERQEEYQRGEQDDARRRQKRVRRSAKVQSGSPPEAPSAAPAPAPGEDGAAAAPAQGQRAAAAAE